MVRSRACVRNGAAKPSSPRQGYAQMTHQNPARPLRMHQLANATGPHRKTLRDKCLPFSDITGDPRRTRTLNLLIRSQLLYPVELWDRIGPICRRTAPKASCQFCWSTFQRMSRRCFADGPELHVRSVRHARCPRRRLTGGRVRGWTKVLHVKGHSANAAARDLGHSWWHANDTAGHPSCPRRFR